MKTYLFITALSLLQVTVSFPSYTQHADDQHNSHCAVLVAGWVPGEVFISPVKRPAFPARP